MGPFRLTPQPENQEELDDVQFTSDIMALMEEENPKLAKIVQMKMDEDEQQNLEAREQEIIKRQQVANSPAPTKGFITRDEEAV